MLASLDKQPLVSSCWLSISNNDYLKNIGFCKRPAGGPSLTLGSSVIFNRTFFSVRRVGRLAALMFSCSPLSWATDNDKSAEDRQKEEELLQQIHKLVETRDFLVDDVEFERLRCAPPHGSASQ